MKKHSWIILFYLIIWSFNCVEVSDLRLTFDAGEAFLVIKSSFCAHFLCLKDLKKDVNSLLHIHIVLIFNVNSYGTEIVSYLSRASRTAIFFLFCHDYCHILLEVWSIIRMYDFITNLKLHYIMWKRPKWSIRCNIFSFTIVDILMKKLPCNRYPHQEMS